MNRIKKFLQHHFENPNYLYFLISLVMLLLLPALATLMIFGDLFFKVTYGVVIVMACIYTSKSYRDMAFLAVLGAVVFILFILFEELGLVSILNPIFTLTFFGFVFTRLMQCVFRPHAVSINDVMALCSGYLILGVIAAPFLFVLDMQLENAFSIPKGAEFYDLLYFSYVTLTGVGYGDIVPVHPAAKSIALVVGIVGQLYLAILVGIIIGKYLSSKG